MGKVEIKYGEWISTAWNAVKSDLTNFAIITLVFFCVSNFSGNLLMGPMIAGFYYLIFKHMRGEKVEIGDLFKGFDYFVDAFVFSLMIGAIAFISVITIVGPFLIPGIMIIGYGLIVEKKYKALDALKASFSIWKENWLHITLFGIVAQFVGAIGAVCCGLGVLITFPIGMYASVIMYKAVVGGVDEGFSAVNPTNDNPAPKSDEGFDPTNAPTVKLDSSQFKD